MKTLTKPAVDCSGSFLKLRPETAADLMTPNPVSLEADALVSEAVLLLTERGFSAAPVIDEAGRPVGVLSQTDLLIHDRETVEHLVPPEAETGAPLPRRMWGNFQLERVDATPVRDLMTPAVFSVNPNTPAGRVIEEMCALNVHRLFVVNRAGILVGVVSALDVLRRLVSSSSEDKVTG